MRNSIRGLDRWGREAREWSRYEGRLRQRAGSGLIGALESYYTQWQAKPTDSLRRQVMTWRLRLHLKWNRNPEFLEELNKAFNIGLLDEEVGETYWKVKAEIATGVTTGFNWRRDSGNAIKGGTVPAEDSEPSEDLAE
ncbi:MAG: hypothetical protein ACR2NF_00605 [Pirellulales bacterium]